MHLGAFSVSLSVKDLATSRAFYERLGFTAFGGNGTNWIMLRNGDTVIGLFQGMFQGNALTFNPGWDQQAQPLASFTDVRDIAKALKADGVALLQDVKADTTGPGSFMLTDPDGNVILVDQHR
jgi:predicted lactoylglutathione lyase